MLLTRAYLFIYNSEERSGTLLAYMLIMLALASWLHFGDVLSQGINCIAFALCKPVNLRWGSGNETLLAHMLIALVIAT